MTDRRREFAREQLAMWFAREVAPLGGSDRLRTEAIFVERLRRAPTQLLHHVFAMIGDDISAVHANPGDGGQITLASLEDGHARRAPSPGTLSDEEGHTSRAHQGQVSSAPSSELSSDDEGQNGRASQGGHASSASSSDSHRDGEGHNAVAPSEGHTAGASPSRPIPKPMDESFRLAMVEEKRKTARTILFALHDGRDIMKAKIRELPAYRAIGAKQASICNRILQHVANARPEQAVEDVVSASTLKQIIAEAEKGLHNVGV